MWLCVYEGVRGKSRCVREFGIQAIRRSYNVGFFLKSLLSNLGCGIQTDNIGGMELRGFKAADFPLDLHFVVIQVVG